MKAHLRGAGVLAAALLVPAFALGQTGPVAAKKPSTERTLVLPETPYNYADLDLPAHFKTPPARRLDNTPRTNPVTDWGATLGRVLFHDTRLSLNNSTACATCHHQKNAFADPTRFSKGFEGNPVDRHAMTIVGTRFYGPGRFFWDERARTLEDQVLMPIQSKVEMGHELPRLMQTLSADKRYPDLYRKAFGSGDVTRERTARALAQFVRSLVSYRSKYDEGLAKVNSVSDDFPNFTAQENRGKSVFMNRCANCHMQPGQSAHFFLTRPRSNGLDASLRGKDGGVGDVTLRDDDLGTFKSPSLRNVAVTGPYMHDGRFATLEAVLDHYSRGVRNGPNVDGRARRAGNFNGSDRAALLAFLRTLTDHQLLADPKYSDPFQ